MFSLFFQCFFQSVGKKKEPRKLFQFSFPWTSEVIKSRTGEIKKYFSQFNKSEK